MTNYDAGRRLEWAVRDALRNDGYEVIRSAGSKSKIDLIALKPGELLMIQVKRSGVCPPAERVELRRLAGLVGGVPLVAYKARVGLGYRLLTGDGPRDFVAWGADVLTTKEPT